ncbi:MAG: MFS transporter [Planctomycetaceae bacterium]|nr:MFS transporter [Planctomycetaceae bacterium]
MASSPTQRIHSPRQAVLRRNLRAMNVDGISFSIMVGMSETYLPAFVLARGMGELTAAMIATVPILLGSILQLAAPLLLQRIGSYRSFVVGMATLQAVSMIALLVMALVQNVAAWAVFIPATIYWASGLATGPAWNTWVEQIVPHQIRPGFFAIRSRMCHIGVLTGLITGGLILRMSAETDYTIRIFAILFGIGSIGRFISALSLGRQSDGHDTTRLANRIERPRDGVRTIDRFQTMFRSLRHPGDIGRFVFFLMAVQTAVHISGPYFTPFMLKSMKMDWVEYMLLLSLGFVGKMISLPWAARIANRFGADRLLWIGGFGIVPISAFWMLNQSVWFLGCIQILSGMVWGCYELAMLLQFFRQIPSDRRVGILTLYNLGNSAAMVLGAIFGAFILKWFGGTRDAYLSVFVGSSLLRLVAMFLMPGRRVAVHSTRLALNSWISRTVAVRPMAGTIERPIFSAIDECDDSSRPANSPVEMDSGETSCAGPHNAADAGMTDVRLRQSACL